MEVSSFVESLKRFGFDFFVGVPCSFFKSVINRLIDDPDIDYHMAVNEGAALAMAAGANLTGKTPVVLLQNSGFGNLVNPLTSLSMVFKIPTLLLISGRHYKVEDEPQHLIMGTRMSEILDGFSIEYQELPVEDNGVNSCLESALEYMKRTDLPYALIVQKNSFSEYNLKTIEELSTSGSLMKSHHVIETITNILPENAVIVGTTGKISRVLYVVDDKSRNFYMQGSMGHAISIGLGISRSQPERKVVVLDGDGATLMHMGALSTVGKYSPKNLLHIVIDNESYDSTGGQYTSSSTTDLAGVAEACGYECAETIIAKEHLTKQIEKFLTNKQKGPIFLVVKVSREQHLGKIPRITESHSFEDTKNRVRSFLRNED